jgi:uncharacterized protein (TIGR02246 family)
MWKRIAFRALWLGIAVTLAAPAPQVFRAAAQGDDDEQAIHLVEDQIEEATGKNNADALSKLWASDYVFVNPAGQLLTGAQRRQMFRSGEMREESYKRDQESIRIYGTTAVVFYRGTFAAAPNDTGVSSQRRVTSVLVRRNGHWQAVSQQSSRIRGAESAATINTIHRKLQGARSAAVGDREQSVREVEQQIADATDKDDSDRLETLWAPEFVWVGPIGNVLTGAQRLAMIRSGREKSGGYTIDQENIRIYGATAVVTFRSTVAGVIDGKDISSRRRVTNVLVELDGRWQAVSQHSTLIQQP